MIKLDHINFTYDNHFPILENACFTLPQGAFCWLTGSSGAGKSTLLKMLHLEIKPSSGDLTILDVNTNKMKRKARCLLKRKIGIVYQNYKLMPNLTIYDNIALPLRLQHEEDGTIQKWTNRIVDWMGLKKKQTNLPNNLSGGEQQRVAIARAIVHRPSLLLADEPTNALDEFQVKRLMDLFYDLNELGCTIIIATHNEALIKQYNAFHLHLEQGKLWAENAC
ncbi:Cell division ATP-binding protein FtsE [Commensalibacter sp. Nvir]|uniref:cell division ATP-binding protein FtsE n=1 Tax=Commensalibacter sp. Nvir TaxID=3069817 RepID=UPI002D752C82|nr:Cell division ATP-binding protein FtsE [Commensalibacter sp. Nvir]